MSTHRRGARQRHNWTFRERTIIYMMKCEYNLAPGEMEEVMLDLAGDAFDDLMKDGTAKQTFGERLNDEATMRFNPTRSLQWAREIDLQAVAYSPAQRILRQGIRADVLDAMRRLNIASRGTGPVVSNTPNSAGTRAEWAAAAGCLAGQVPTPAQVSNARQGFAHNAPVQPAAPVNAVLPTHVISVSMAPSTAGPVNVVADNVPPVTGTQPAHSAPVGQQIKDRKRSLSDAESDDDYEMSLASQYGRSMKRNKTGTNEHVHLSGLLAEIEPDDIDMNSIDSLARRLGSRSSALLHDNEHQAGFEDGFNPELGADLPQDA